MTRQIKFGAYRGTVVDNADPDQRNRVKVRIPGLHDDSVPDQYLPWADVVLTGLGQGQGERKMPKQGISVLIFFQGGDPDFPVVVGEWLTTEDVRNVSEETYVAGDKVDIVDGDRVQQTFGQIRETGTHDKLQNYSGRLVREARSIEENSSGSRIIEASREERKIYGDVDHSIEGSVKQVIGGSLSIGAILEMALSAGLGFELLAVLAGIKLTAANVVTGSIKFQIGAEAVSTVFMEMRAVDFLGPGVVVVGTSLLTSPPGPLTLARPVTTIEHIHAGVGNLGLPVVTFNALPGPPLPPTPGTGFGISRKLFTE